MSGLFPFSAVVGQEDAKLALQLAALDPRLGGVLLRGDKGSAKTTLARGLAGLLAPGAPFVDLPLGATEDRVVGTLDLGAALSGGEVRLRPGLLAQVDGGVLYVDEINLLADHLVDTLLDVAVTGINVVERDGLSDRHPARFVLVGSMNPEEGELRPQLLDRFGLCVEVRAPAEAADRVAAVRRRLAHDAGEGAGSSGSDDAVLARLLAEARPAVITDEVIDAAARLALAVGAEGLRADLALCRAAAARAGLDGRTEVTDDDLRRVAPLVLAHRARRSPFDPPTLPPEALEDAVEDVLGPPPDEEQPPSDPPTGGDQSAGDGDAPPPRPVPVGPERRPPRFERPAMVRGPRGRQVRDVPHGEAPDHPVAVVGSIREAARHPADPPARHLRARVGEVRAERLLVLAVDLSGSMGAPERAAAATGTVLGLLSRAYQQRDRVALVGFRAGGAEVLLRPTASVEVARNRLGQLETGGDTPLAAGLQTALELTRAAGEGTRPLVAVLTDGRATGSERALDDALGAAAAIGRASVDAIVLDCESGRARLGLAGRVAAAMGADCVAVDGLEPVAITDLLLARPGVA